MLFGGHTVSEHVLFSLVGNSFRVLGGGLVYCLDRVFLKCLDHWTLHHVTFRP